MIQILVSIVGVVLEILLIIAITAVVFAPSSTKPRNVMMVEKVLLVIAVNLVGCNGSMSLLVERDLGLVSRSR